MLNNVVEFKEFTPASFIKTYKTKSLVFLQELIMGINVGFYLCSETREIKVIKDPMVMDCSEFEEWVNRTIDPEDLCVGVVYSGVWLSQVHQLITDYVEDAYDRFYLYDLVSMPELKMYPATNEAGLALVKKYEEKGLSLAPCWGVYTAMDFLDLKGKHVSFLKSGKPYGVIIKDYHYTENNKHVFFIINNFTNGEETEDGKVSN